MIFIVGPVEVQELVKINRDAICYGDTEYSFYGIKTRVSGHGFEMAKCIKMIEGDVKLVSVIAKDEYYDWITRNFNKYGIEKKYLKYLIERNVHSVVLHDKSYRKHILDLKDIQSVVIEIDDSLKEEILNSDILVLCNINYSRTFFEYAKKYKIKVATDIHAQENINDLYNKEFMKNADILFMNNDKIKCNEIKFIKKLIQLYNNEIIVISLKNKGILMYLRRDKRIYFSKFNKYRQDILSEEYYDYLFASYLHYLLSYDEILAMDKAMCYIECIAEKNIKEQVDFLAHKFNEIK